MARQLNHDRKQQSVGDLPAELLVHLARDKKAASHQRVESAVHLAQLLSEVRRLKTLGGNQGSRRLESHQNIVSVVGKKYRCCERVGTAEGIEHNWVGGVEAVQFLARKIAQRGQALGFESFPDAVALLRVSLPLRSLVQLPETAAIARSCR